jgi:hypothetical protein
MAVSYCVALPFIRTEDVSPPNPASQESKVLPTT